MAFEYTPIPLLATGVYPLTNVTPFTYRDGMTYQKALYELIGHLNRVIGTVNDSNKALYDTVIEQLNETITIINNALSQQTEDVVEALDNQQVEVADQILTLTDYVDTEIGNLTTYVNTTVESIINDSIELQDPVMAGIAQDSNSEFRGELNNIIDGRTPVVSVNNFGGVGDGITDDSVAIQAALDYAVTNGYLLTGVGVFATSQEITVPDGKLNVDSLHLKALAPFTGDYLLALRQTGSVFPHNDSEIFRCVFDSEHITGGLLVTSALRVNVDNCRFFNFATNGLRLDIGHDLHEVYVDACHFRETKITGVPRTGTAIHVRAHDNKITNCTIAGAKIGIYVERNYNTFNGNHLYSCEEYGMFFHQNATHPVIIDNYFDGVNLWIQNPDHITVTGNLFLASINDVNFSFIEFEPMGGGQFFRGNIVENNSFRNIGSVVVESMRKADTTFNFSATSNEFSYIRQNRFQNVYTRVLQGKYRVQLSGQSTVAVDLTGHRLHEFAVRQVIASFIPTTNPRQHLPRVESLVGSVATIVFDEPVTGTLTVEYDCSAQRTYTP